MTREVIEAPTHCTVQGVRLELTPKQRESIRKELRKRERCRNDFVKMLKHLQFVPAMDDDNKIVEDVFIHKYYSWTAIIQKRSWGADVWMIGSGLKDIGFPGGYVYDCPTQIEEEIINALDNDTSEKKPWDAH